MCEGCSKRLLRIKTDREGLLTTVLPRYHVKSSRILRKVLHDVFISDCGGIEKEQPKLAIVHFLSEPIVGQLHNCTVTSIFGAPMVLVEEEIESTSARNTGEQ